MTTSAAAAFFSEDHPRHRIIQIKPGERPAAVYYNPGGSGSRGLPTIPLSGECLDTLRGLSFPAVEPTDPEERARRGERSDWPGIKVDWLLQYLNIHYRDSQFPIWEQWLDNMGAGADMVQGRGHLILVSPTHCKIVSE